MRKILAICLVALLSGCSLLQKTKKDSNINLTENKIGAQTTIVESDSSKRKLTEVFRLIIPGVNGSSLPGFVPYPLPDLNGTTDTQKQAFLDLKSKYEKLLGNQREGSKLGSALILEYQKTLEEALNKLHHESKSDSTINRQAVIDTKEVKSPEALSWIGIVVIALAAIQVVKWLTALYPLLKR